MVTPLADGSTWVVLRDFGYDVGSAGSGERIDVRIGFQTDFASIPRVFWMVLPKWGRYGNAAVIHDWLDWTQERTRADADRIFLEGMQVLGVRPPTRWTIYMAVRWFGDLAWIRNRADRAAGYDRVVADVQVKAVTESARPGTVRRVLGYATGRLVRRTP